MPFVTKRLASAIALSRSSPFARPAAITAGLAKGLDLEVAVGDAKEFVTGAIEHSLAIGKGIGPVNPTWRLEEF